MDILLFSAFNRTRGLLAFAAVLTGAILALTLSFGGGANQGQRSVSPGISPSISLGLTAEALQSFQQGGNAFPSNSAGFSAYYRVPNGSGGFGFNKNTIDQVLFNSAVPTQRRTGPATVVDIGTTHSVGTLPIRNIDGLTTTVNLYLDDQGWLVAYFPAGSESSRAWQASQLDVENPVLTDVSQTTLLDAINDVLVEALRLPPVNPDQLGYYHWQYPTATDFLMIATARGRIGVDTVSFAIPTNFSVQEVSVSMWITKTNLPCARSILDGVNITGDWCDRNFRHELANLTDFNSRSVHTLVLEHYSQDLGASGATVMLIYSNQ